MRSRTLVFLGALVLCSTAGRALDFTPPVCAEPPLFSDMSVNVPACPWVQKAVQDGVIPGCSGGTFCPDQPVTRKQAAAFLERAMRGTSSWSPGQAYYARTIIVNPVPGNPQASGAALLAAVAATNPATISNRYLIKLEPGTYDVSGTLGVQLRPYVDLEGSGAGVTTIIAQSLLDSNLVFMQGETALRFVSVRGEMSQGNPTSVSALGPGIHRLTHVHVESLVGNGLACQLGSTLKLEHSRLESRTFTALTLSDCDATVEDSDIAVNRNGGSAGGALAISVGGSALRLFRSRVFAVGGTSSDIALQGIDATIFLEGVHLLANYGSSGNPIIAAVSLVRSNATIVASDLEAMGTSANRWALLAESDSGAHVTRVRGSRFANGSIQASASDDIFIADSQLDAAGLNPNGGAITCHKSFDENFANPGGLSVCP